MYQLTIFCFIVLIGMTINAQTTGEVINVRGAVTCEDQPVAGAIVTLSGQNMKDTTDDNGEYAITKNVVAVLPSILPQTEKITFRNGVLELSLPKSSPVKIHLFDGAMPDVIFIPVGLGHTAYDKYLRGKGVNPHSIIDQIEDPLSGQPTWWSTRVQLIRI